PRPRLPTSGRKRLPARRCSSATARYVSVLNDTAVRPWALRGPEPGRSSPIPRDNALTGLCALILINAPLAGAADDASHPQEDREVSTVQGTYNDKVVRQFPIDRKSTRLNSSHV